MQEWFLAQDGVFIYTSLFLLLMAGVVGLPVPEDLPLILGGIVIQLGKGEPWAVFLVCYLTVVLGDLVIFSIGRYFGPRIFRTRWLSKRSTKTKLKRIRVQIERKSILAVFLARHLFYLRTVTFLACGALNMRFSRFLIADAVAALISVPLMLALGYFAADHYEEAMVILHEAKLASIGLLILLIAGFFWYRRKLKQEEANDVELAEALCEEELEREQNRPTKP